MPVYPGTEPPRISQATTIRDEGFAEKLITMFSHTGTHIDAPAHMVEGAATLDALPAAHFVGRAAVVDLRGLQGGSIGKTELARHEGMIAGSDFLLLMTGWSDRWGKKGYFSAFPVLSREAAQWLAGLGLKGIGVDAISVDPVDTRDFPNHGVLFAANMVIVENLRSLEELPSEGFLFCCAPLAIEDADGSPVRALAILV